MFFWNCTSKNSQVATPPERHTPVNTMASPVCRSVARLALRRELALVRHLVDGGHHARVARGRREVDRADLVALCVRLLGFLDALLLSSLSGSPLSIRPN